MKKLFLSITVIFVLASCTSAYENDVKKMARLTCEIQKLSMKAINGDEAAEEELKKKEQEAKELEDKMIKDYAGMEDDKEMQQKAEALFEEELKDCMKEK